jgi:hypothetical protein
LVKSEPSIALILFTNEGEAENWPRGQIYDMFKKQNAPIQMRIALLEHFLHEWSDKDPQVAAWLIEEYRENVFELRESMLFTTNDDLNVSQNYVQSRMPNSDTLIAVDELNRARKKLVEFLEVNLNINKVSFFSM